MMNLFTKQRNAIQGHDIVIMVYVKLQLKQNCPYCVETEAET